MTFQEFTQKVKEYGAARTPQLTEKEYALIEKVYAFHPSISETMARVRWLFYGASSGSGSLWIWRRQLTKQPSQRRRSRSHAQTCRPAWTSMKR